MNSILTNGSALAALDTLRTIDSQLGQTQSRIASGYRVETASDNSAYWSIATTMRSDNKALSAVVDALALGAATIDTAYTGMNSAIDVVKEVKAKLVAAREPGVDREKIDKELTELKNQLLSISSAASFNGQNFLDFTDVSLIPEPPASIVGGVTRSTDGTVSVQTIDFERNKSSNTDLVYLTDNSTSVGDYGILTNVYYSRALSYAEDFILIKTANASRAGFTEIKLSSATADADVGKMISVVDAMLENMIDVAADYGAISMRVAIQSEYVADLSDTIESGIGRLVDADMNEESTRLKALQTQQQLGIQALSIANSSSESIIALFR